MLRIFGSCFALALMLAPLSASALPNAAVTDPPRNAAFPAHNQQLLIPSQGLGMNAVLFIASGKGPHPTVILMHGLPGNERNLDLAQAIRRAGWNVLTFTYRGAWGSPGDFSIANLMEDAAAALEFARSPRGAKLGIDVRHIVLAGHSMGGAAALLTAARLGGVDGLILLDAANLAATARQESRDELIAGLDDLGNSLHGASRDGIADEILSRGAQWDNEVAAARLNGLPVLSLASRHALGPVNRPVNAALTRAGAHLTATEMDTDHAFADHRIALATAVVRWLRALGVRP